jgi:hypothetical protein
MIEEVGLTRRIVLGLVCTTALAAAPAALGASSPPTRKDPCVSGTKDICGTTGVGFYKTYSYGTRWFGDYKAAIPGTSHTYCIDLRFWYPGPQYNYKEDTSTTLVNKSGETVPLPNTQRIAFAVWVYGRSNDPDQTAAVMLYVHNQMGDARPGEVSPSVIGGQTATLYDQIAKAAAKYHGPYRFEVKVPDSAKVGTATTATVRILAAGGAAVPNFPLSIGVTGATGVTKPSTTDASGVAKVTMTPSGGSYKVSATTTQLPSTLPRVFKPTTAAAAPNGQRLVLPAAQTISDSAGGTASKVQVRVVTNAAPTSLVVGKSSQDKVTISNASPDWSGTVQVRVYGPSRTEGVTCTGTPVATTSFTAKGNGTFTSPAVTTKVPGYYAYQETIPGNAGTIGLTTPCNQPSERFRVDTLPTVATTVSAQTAAPGTGITDTVKVAGLNGESATVTAALYGPFGSKALIKCTGTPVWTGTIPATADGTFTTAAFTVQTPGYYTYHESIAASGFVRATRTTCADTAETTVVTGQPKIVTQVSSQQAAPGKTITDKVTISGLGVLQAPVDVKLWGPFETRGGIACTGTPYWTGSFTATGNGSYNTRPVTLTKAGYYVYQESIADTPAYAGFTAPCAAAPETTVSHATPTLSTVVTNEVARPDTGITDEVTVKGLGKTQAKIEVTLYGPFATRAAIGCSSAPAGMTSFTATKGDGVYTSPPILVKKSGFYIFREHLIGSALVKDVLADCTSQSEVSLAAPQIITGRGDVTHVVRVHGVLSALTPTRVAVSSVNIDAPVSPVGIDVGQGVLGVSPNIHHTGWWADGATPGDREGSVLIAGHVDSATAGAGAFFNLKNAKPGSTVAVTTAGGRTLTYKVSSVKSYLKAMLPTDVWSKKGRARLVLVTCGGPFDHKTKHYVDNIVLTAYPA